MRMDLWNDAPNPERDIAEMISLLNGHIENEQIDPHGIRLLRRLADSWIAAGYRLDEWPEERQLTEHFKPVDVWLLQADGQPPQFLPIYKDYQDPYEDPESEANLERRGRAKAYFLFTRFITSLYYADLHQ